MKKSQISVEYLIIFGISLTVILILVGVFFNYSDEVSKKLDEDFLETFSSNLIQNVEKIHFLGIGNKMTLKVSFPSNVINITFEETITTQNGENFITNYINITYLSTKGQNSLIRQTNSNFIKVGCSNECITINKANKNISYYDNIEVLNGGPKQIKIENKGDFVSVDFYR